MTTQAQYTREEWETLEFAPLWMLSAIGGADANIEPNEVAALVKEISEASLYKEQLVRDVLFSLGNSDFDDVMARYRQDPRPIDQGLSHVADALDRHATPEQAQAFKRSMIGIGAEIAKAAGPIFGSKVSVEEEGALAGCAAALRLQL